jgi:hypothetical protein
MSAISARTTGAAARIACQRLIGAFAPARVRRRELERGIPEHVRAFGKVGEND